MAAELSSITLLGNDPGDRQWSMLSYGSELAAGLTALLGDRCRISLESPDTRNWDGLRRWRAGRALAMYASRYLRYPKLLRGRRADIYHILDQGNSFLAKSLDPARTLVTCHDLIPLIFDSRRFSLWPSVSRKTWRHAISGLFLARLILANSDCTRRDLTSRLGIPAERIRVIPLGINPLFSPPADAESRSGARKMFGLPDGDMILHVGQAAFYKNLEGAAKALRILLERKEPVWLVRCGPPSSGFLEIARRLRVTDRVIMLGPLPMEKLRLLYQAADVLIQPSWYEGLGLPPLEAMASGLPVVVSNRGALPETVGDAGLVVDPEDPKQLADSVEKALRDPAQRASLIQKGLRRASEFTWEKTCRQTLQAYQSVFEQRISAS